ncbi:MAG TPA: hypothetical protein VLB81_06290 [Gaiellales bacterium]|nr:hypothetical protein [Gaiellales bacterium]
MVVDEHVGDLRARVEGGLVQEADGLLGRLRALHPLVGPGDLKPDVIGEAASVVRAREQSLDV